MQTTWALGASALVAAAAVTLVLAERNSSERRLARSRRLRLARYLGTSARATPRGMVAEWRRRLRSSALYARVEEAGVPRGPRADRVLALAVGLVALAGAVAGAGVLAMGAGWGRAVVVAAASTVAAVVLVRLALERRVWARRERLAAETPLVAQVLRLLFEAGLPVEAALRNAHKELAEIAPVSHGAFSRVLVRVDAGDELGAALRVSARHQGSPAFAELVEILEQTARLGGGVRARLDQLIRAAEGERRLRLTERVNRLSGQMSVVMMVCLFPALLIVLAGPALVALVRAFADVG